MKIKKVRVLCETNYVMLKNADYKTLNNNEKNWAYLERKNKREAAVIIPLLKKSKEIILIKQFRVPLNNYVIEFPAGLIDEGESIEKAALRELKEETGYKGKVIHISSKLSSSAGISSEIIYMVVVDILGEPQSQNLEDSEDIEVLKIPLNLVEKELDYFSSKGFIIDAKVWTLLRVAKSLKKIL